ncbi:hypothetical protein [Streptomyces sp. NBC_01408]|uniref:hypothetical protein n=1 Tax=Streptomyces sp. NBC_01408 TaxID=2903855 RepID=UPI0022576D85|nr:hypothetical protein [Streptomyces sp. NBC_01408]MCX4692389.1 hypothetical protein [Streptomyces sp. NBC_01408]
MRSTRRTTLRSTAVVAGAAAVLALPVGSAFADSPAVPEPQVLPGIEQPPVGPKVDPSVEPSVEPKVDPSVEPQVDPSVEPKADRTNPPTTPPVKPKPGLRAYVTTVKLADGSIAKVYKIGDQHFEADIYAGPTKLDTLVSKGGAAAYGQNNGLHVVLQPNGTVTSWVEGAPKPKPPVEKPKPQVKPEVKKVTSVRIAIADGRIAKLVDGPDGKRVEVSLPNGNPLGTIDLKHPAVYKDGWTYKLVQDGKRVKFVVIDGKSGGNSWVYDFSGKLLEEYLVDTGKKDVKDVQKDVQDVQKDVRPADQPAVGKVVPKGGVQAGAEGVTPAKGDTPVLVAAGGGMAAVGAAGLGFALLRRHRAGDEG